MRNLRQGVLARALLAAACLATLSMPAAGKTGKAPASIRRVAALAGNSVEVEITTSDPVKPQVQVATGPDRLILDFPNTLPGSLHTLSINRNEVKDVRVGLFSTNPPVTRVVIDLKSPQSYELFPAGRSVIVKLGSGGKEASISGAAVHPVAVRSRLEVFFENGKLSIWADKVTLAEVLSEVRRRTGAEISIPPGSDQELVAANYGPAPAREVLASLLNGSRFNFIMVGSTSNPGQLRSVLLTPRGQALAEPASYSAPTQVAQVVTEDTGPVAQPDSPPEQREADDTPQPPPVPQPQR